MDLIFSNPIILITSSTRSISPKISGLQLGTLTLRNLPLVLTVKPKFDKIFFISLVFMLVPTVFDTILGSNFISRSLNFFVCFTSNLETSPPQISKISSTAKSNPAVAD